MLTPVINPYIFLRGVFLLGILIFSSISTVMFWPLPAHTITETQQQQFNHFVKLNHELIQASQGVQTLCPSRMVHLLETINQYVWLHPFIATELLRQGQGDMPLNLTLQQARCLNNIQQYPEVLRVLDRGAAWTQPMYLVGSTHQEYHLYVIERAEAYSHTEQWQAMYTLLNEYVHGPLAAYGNLTTQTNIMDLWASALLSQGQLDDARRMFIRYLGLLQGHFPNQVTEIQRITGLIQSLRTPSPNEPGADHYVDVSDPELHRWHPTTQRIVVWFAPLTPQEAASFPAHLVSLLQWSPSRQAGIQRALHQWEEALASVQPIQFAVAQHGEPYDVAFRLVPSLEKNQFQEAMGYNIAEFSDNVLVKNDVLLTVLNASGQARTDAQIYATALHEIGHMMGLGHSPYVGDVMSGMRFSQYGLAPPTQLSLRDKTSIQTLYQQTAIKRSSPPGLPLSKANQVF